MSTDLAEGFYWVRYVDPEEPEPFVAQRFASTWFVPGQGETVKGTKLDVLSERLVFTQPAVARARARVSTGR